MTFLAALLGIAVQVELTLPVTAAGLRLSAADPLALAGAVLFIGAARRHAPSFRLPALPIGLAALSAMVILSFAVGVARFGVTGWAAAKAAGWFLLLAYFAAGAWVAAALNDRARRRLVQGAILTAVAVGTVQSALLALAPPMPDELIVGLTGNRNAFAFVLLAMQAVLYAFHRNPRPLWAPGPWRLLLGLSWIALWCTGSRTGVGAGLLMAAAAVVREDAGWRDMAVPAAVLVLLIGANHLGTGKQLGPFLGGVIPPAFAEGLTATDSFKDRAAGYPEAFALWRAHPILGIGLGGFMRHHQAAFGLPQVVHSTPLWILTEMGLAGALVFAAFAWKLVKALAAHAASAPPEERSWPEAALLMLLAFLVMSLLQELLYQRILWLILGLTLTVPRREVQ